MKGFAEAYETILRTVVDDLLVTIADIPEDDLNTWLPSAASADRPMNTFAAIAIHTSAAGEFMTTHAVGGAPSSRDREAEFRATATHAGIRTAFDTWLEHIHDLVPTLTDADLAAEPHAARFRERGWTRGAALLHAIDHTGLHLGHLQVQRQLWDADRAAR